MFITIGNTHVPKHINQPDKIGTYLVWCAFNALTQMGTRPERVRHFMLRVFSGRVCWYGEIQVFFGSLPENGTT